MPPYRRAADARAAAHPARVRVKGGANVIAASSSVGVSEDQHVVRETTVGKDCPREEEMPEKLPRRDEKVGAISGGVGAPPTNLGGKEKMRSLSRFPGRLTSTSIIRTTGNSCSRQQLSPQCSINADVHTVPSMDAHDNSTTRLWSKPATEHCAKEKATVSSSQRILERHRAKQAGSNEERLANLKQHKGSSGEMPQKHQGKPRMTSNSRRPNAKTGPPLDGNSTANDCIEPCAKENTVVHVPESNDFKLQEADDAIRRLNELGLGEDISPEEYMECFKKLPDNPFVNTYLKLDSEQMIPIYLRHARYRIRYYKLSQRALRVRQNCAADLLEKEDFSDEFLQKMGYFVKFENDGTFDWSFPPDLCKIQDLDDYQRLVPHDSTDFGTYANWDRYRITFHSYETELEYLSYCSALSEKLKWMEDYVLIQVPSVKWGKISTRGAFQAMKMATTFSKITPSLADTAFRECVGYMRWNVSWLKGLVKLYFEIWVLVTKQKKSFRDAMEEVYKMNTVPVMVIKLKIALERDCSEMETEFHTYTENVTSGVTHDEAHSLITEAVEKLVERPKYYQHYIRKKIDIAQSIGLIPVDVDLAGAKPPPQTFWRRWMPFLFYN